MTADTLFSPPSMSLAGFHWRELNVINANSSNPEAGNSDLVHFCQVAALVITVYDHLITLDLEVSN
ncbi:hypothetical protein B0H34DRAFT_218679 [Crassisporium funariophilum]|nr:hypothetical protein B0H34DRAFT_218679 [Crassisporium funariophilum]